MSALADQLAARIAREPRGTRPLLVGLCGAQGSGKSTLAEAVVERLAAQGTTCAIVSLDDLYLTRAQREVQARDVHPLFATRGVPGTHDVALGHDTFDRLGGTGTVALPRFDKGTDDRVPVREWPTIEAPVDVILFEGWCVGAVPQPAANLSPTINALEDEEDEDCRWRRHVNVRLAGDYAGLFARIDLLVLLAAPSFDVVFGWRKQQERALHVAGKPRAMDDAQIARFIQHYERLTRWILEEMPARADVLVRIGADREVVETRGL